MATPCPPCPAGTTREGGAMSKLDKLKGAGMIKKDLPKAHADAVESLSDDDVDTLIAVKAKLDAADEPHLGKKPNKDEDFTIYMLF